MFSIIERDELEMNEVDDVISEGSTAGKFFLF